MIIQWYPGHMTKAIRMMEKEIKLVDAIIYVLDARAPFSSVNPKFTKLIGEKPIIYVLNKTDMANEEVTKEWFSYFSKKGSACVMLNSTQSGSAKKIETALNEVLKAKAERLKNKNINLIIRAMVLGVPNSGKSTLINNLSNKAKTVTGNRPGVTKGKQWVKIQSGIEILDTPGTLWPAFDNNRVAKHLAYIGSISEKVLDIPNLSIEFIKDILKIDKNILIDRFKINILPEDEPLDILNNICKVRGFIARGGECDYDRGSLAIMNEFKQGKYGRVSLEKVKDINDLLINDRIKEKKDN